MANGGANFWYKLKNENKTSDGAALLDEAGCHYVVTPTRRSWRSAGKTRRP